jgi:hypothetical protein
VISARQYLLPMSDPSTLRVADADRERVVGELREHMVAGRLTAEEFEQRLGAAYSSSTQADLDAVKADLPMTPAVLAQALAERKAHLRRRLMQEAGGASGAWLISVAVWLAIGASGEFWPIWVIIATSLPLVRDAWRILGPAPDLEAVEADLNARREHKLARERARQHQLPH